MSALFAALLAGCSSFGPIQAPQVSPPATLSYELGPCRGFCPAYRVTLTGGDARFEGLRHTATLGVSPFRSDPRLTADLIGILDPVASSETNLIVSHEGCSIYATDQQTVTVKWRSPRQAERSIAYDLGCRDPRYGSVLHALGEVRRKLPIDGFVGRTTPY